MKRQRFLLFYFLLFLPSLALPQSVVDSEKFFDSLPDGFKEELINEETQADQEIDTLFSSQTSLEKTKVLLKRLREQLESIEDRIAIEQGFVNEGVLTVFGSNFFTSFSTSYAPINMPNLDGNYLVDVGDLFKVTVIGSNVIDFEAPITRDGTIFFPEFGKLSIAGLTLTQAEEKMKSFVDMRAIGSEAIVELRSLRDIQVVMLGLVQNPGVYTIAGGSGLIQALNAAGGIHQDGSYRKIQISRGNNVIKEVDLYDLLVFGDSSIATMQLRSGDVVLVKPASFHVPASGGINKNAIYEILEGETLSDLISFAGGVSQDFYGYDQINIYRAGYTGFQELTLSLDESNNFLLKPRDTLIVPSYDNEVKSAKYVHISGRVKNPGTYRIEDGDRLSDLIERSGGYLDDAYLYGSALFRKTAIEKAEKFSKLAYKDVVSFVISRIGVQNSAVNQQVLPILQEELKSNEFEGRIVTNFDLQALQSDPSLDIELEHDDRIIIPTLEKVVYMFGEFNNPTNAIYSPALSPQDYVDIAGGLKDKAQDKLVIIGPDGSTEIFTNSLFALHKPDIYPGSIIYSTKDIGKRDGLEFSATLAPVLSSLAISLASLNSISD